MAVSSSTDWFMSSSTKFRGRTYVQTFITACKLPSSHFVSNSKLPSFIVKSSGFFSSTLEEAPTNFGIVELDVEKHDVLQDSPNSDSDSLNDFLCGLFKDPKTKELAYEYYQRLKQRVEFKPRKSLMQHLTRYLLRFKRWDFLISLSEDFTFYNVFPDTYTCYKLISNCIRAKKFMVVQSLVEVFASADTDLSVLAFDTAMRGYNKLHMFRSTKEVYEKMMSAKVVPDSRCYLSAMEANMKTGDYENVVQLFDEIQERRLLEVSPYVAQIYCILIESLGQLGRAFVALKYFREMTKRRVERTPSVYSSLIRSFANLSEFSKAEELFEEAKGRKMLSDPDVYMKLVLMYIEAGQVEKTCAIAKAMKASSLKATDCILCTIINAFAKKKGYKDAIRVFQELVSHGCEPGQVTYASIINAYCRLGLYSKAEMIFSEMERKGFDKCLVAYSNMIAMYGKAGKPREAMRLLAKMKERRCQPNVWVYNALIDMQGRAKNLRQIEKLWREMQRRKIAPDKVTYTSIISAYGKAGEHGKGMKFYKEYRLNGGSIDKALAGIMVGICSRNSDVDELLQLLRDMKLEGTEMDERLYYSSLNALNDAGLHVQTNWLKESFYMK